MTLTPQVIPRGKLWRIPKGKLHHISLINLARYRLQLERLHPISNMNFWPCDHVTNEKPCI